MSENPAHEEAALAFATHFEFARMLVTAQGRDTLTPEAKSVLARWLSIMVDGADGFIDQQNQAGADATPELQFLAKQATEANDWLNELNPNEPAPISGA